MGKIIQSFQGVFAQYRALFKRQLRLELAGMDIHKKTSEELLKPLFESYWAACDNYFHVVDGKTSYTEEKINEDLLVKQAVVFGFEGRGLIGAFVFGDGDPHDLENVLSLLILVKFDLDSLSAPDCPFVQLRMWEVVKGKIILGETFFTLEGSDITLGLLSDDGGLEMIAHKGIKGYLPGMESET